LTNCILFDILNEGRGNKMKNNLMTIIVLMTVLAGCGSNTSTTGAQGPAGPQGPAGAAATPAPTAAPNAITAEVARYNAQLAFNGQAPITQGLQCQLWTINTAGISAVNSIAAFNNSAVNVSGDTTYVGAFLYQGTFDQANSATSTGLSVLPNAVNDDLRDVYQNYFVLKCHGYLVVTQPGYYPIVLTSDDGAILTINGSQLNNDGQHGATTVSKAYQLNEGVVGFELDFYQYNGSQALQLYSNGSPVPAANFYH